jgi:ABC-2 type transport system ATP-binding protein
MIETRNLCKTYGTVEAVRNVSLSVPAGQIFCFLGPNGAGKTTTIKMLTGLLRPTSGEALIAGIDVEKDPVAAKRLLSYIPDMPYLYERLTVTEFYLFIAELYAVPREKALSRKATAFDLFGLDPYAAALVKDLSHGYRQRLLYATSFLHDPRVLFIDEPLIGLDPYTIRLIKDLLRERARAGMTIFLTTHILALAADIADYITIILNGEIAARGTLDAILQQTGSDDLEQAFLSLTDGTKG